MVKFNCPLKVALLSNQTFLGASVGVLGLNHSIGQRCQSL